MKLLDLDAIRARAAGTVTSPLRQGRRDTPANEDALALLAYVADLEERCRAYEAMRSDIARALDTWKQEEVNDET